MNIKLELLKDYIAEYVNSHLIDFDIDVNRIADSKAIAILANIQTVIKNTEYNDFDVVEEIVNILETNGISCSGRHDFG